MGMMGLLSPSNEHLPEMTRGFHKVYHKVDKGEELNKDDQDIFKEIIRYCEAICDKCDDPNIIHDIVLFNNYVQQRGERPNLNREFKGRMIYFFNALFEFENI